MHQHRSIIVNFFAIAFATLLSVDAQANVTPNSLVSDGMVLQRERKVNLWGTAEPGERVAVSFRGQDAPTTADQDGKWRVQIDSQQAGGPFTLTIAGKNTVRLENVLVGEVWVCSGQSNMWWPVANRAGAKALLGTENSSIRLLNVPQRLAQAPESSVEAKWTECGPETLVNFSAVAYYFARDVNKALGVPVGLIHASYGGSGVGQWISAQALAEDPALEYYRKRKADETEAQARQRERLKPEIERYEAAVAEAKKAGKEPPAPPRGMMASVSRGSQLYNGMIAPLVPFTIRGALWYQGEANVGNAADYEPLFSSMIRGWRRDWGQGDFPFLFVQIAPYLKIVDQPQESNSAELREAQLRTSLAVPHTAMAVITDWGHETDIHVKQKEPVGQRLAWIARSVVYGEKLVPSGPLFKSMKVEEGKAVLSFDHVGAGLVTKRLVYEDISKDPRVGQGGALHVAAGESGAAVPLQGFTIAGEDQKFVNAQAEIQGSEVVVSSPDVSKPAAVRYGWANYPTGNLFNREGLPASPFRTDSWPRAAETRKEAR